MAGKRAATVQARVGAERRAATEGELLAATRRLLEAGEGVTALSVERIGTEAGVSRATFYLHFKDKYDLISRLADELFSFKDDRLVAALADPDLARNAVAAVMHDIVARWVENQAVLSAIIELAEYDERMREAWRAAVHEVAERGAELLRAHWADGAFPPADPETISELIVWMFERSCHQITRDPGREDELAEAMAEIVWRLFDYPGAD